MKIELKRIQYSSRLSEETNAFAADLYINDIKAGEAKNEGHGGPTHYYARNEQGRQLITEAEAYCKNLPPVKYAFGRREGSYDMNLEHYIDDLLENHLDERELQKFKNKMNKDMLKGIVIGVPNANAYSAWSFNTSIDQILAHPRGTEQLTNEIKKLIPKLTDGKIILNTNIPEQILKNAGFNKTQYAAPEEKQATLIKIKKTPQKGRGI